MLRGPVDKEKQELIRRENEEMIEGFQSHLQNKELTENSIEKHVYNITYFLNEYLLYRDKRPEEAILEMNNFIGKWFIKKTPWVTASAITSMINSIKHFYRFLLLQERISQRDLNLLLQKFKRSQKDWINRLKSTNY